MSDGSNTKRCVTQGTSSGVRQAAEKVRSTEDRPQGLKPSLDLAAFVAVRDESLTYQSCPDTNPAIFARDGSFSAALI